MGRKPKNTPKPVDSSPEELDKSTNIKERLNLHVKRRLQVTPSFAVPSTSSDSFNTSFAESCAEQIDNKTQTPPTPSEKGRLGKRGKTKQKGEVAAKRKNLQPAPMQLGGSGVDDECSRDDSSSCIDNREKEPKAPCLLTMALNAKKLSLFRDPEVVHFLQNIVNAIRN